MFIVTTLAGDGERSGCLVGFATQCSIHPPRFLTCISKVNHTFGVVQRSNAVVVHFLGTDQRELAAVFGHETGDQVDKFSEVEWSPGPEEIPVLAGVPGWFAARILDRFDLGDHVGLWLDPFAAEDRNGPVDLGFQAVKPVEPGHPA
jgi:flavin reductase (DIM6/NTAB) family NADH-FMN oxidoreductase RutF